MIFSKTHACLYLEAVKWLEPELALIHLSRYDCLPRTTCLRLHSRLAVTHVLLVPSQSRPRVRYQPVSATFRLQHLQQEALGHKVAGAGAAPTAAQTRLACLIPRALPMVVAARAARQVAALPAPQHLLLLPPLHLRPQLQSLRASVT